MEPHLRDGDRVLLTTRPARIGDVVLARHPRGLSLHRLVWGPPLPWVRAMRTKADRGRIWDAPLSADSVLATVVDVEGRDLPRRPWLAVQSLALGLLARAREVFSR